MLDEVQAKLRAINSLPPRGTFWDDPDNMGALLADVLAVPGKSQFVRYELVLVSGDVVNHYDLGARYAMGRLPLVLGLRAPAPLLSISGCARRLRCKCIVLPRPRRRYCF